MSSIEVTERATELVAERRPFVRATVVRAQAPTSVRAGDDAIVLADGTLEGFVGGQCTQNSVRTAALAALQGEAATLLRVLPDDSDPFPATPGAQVVVNPCQSGGAVEIFLEPVLPPPLVAITGATPIARSLRAMARTLGYGLVEAPGVAPGAAVDSGVRTAADLAGCAAVVLASHGPGEAETIRACLDADVPYIGLVASRKRAAAVFDDLGLTPAERARIDAPAGRWIGARTGPEIALSILAAVVASVRLGDPRRETDPEPAGSPAHGDAVDPVCGMAVTVMADTTHARVGGADYYFCNPRCRETFLAEHPATVR